MLSTVTSSTGIGDRFVFFVATNVVAALVHDNSDTKMAKKNKKEEVYMLDVGMLRFTTKVSSGARVSSFAVSEKS